MTTVPYKMQREEETFEECEQSEFVDFDDVYYEPIYNWSPEVCIDWDDCLCVECGEEPWEFGGSYICRRCYCAMHDIGGDSDDEY